MKRAPWRRLLFVMKTDRSGGQSRRIDKGPITNDMHVSSLYARMVHYERRAREARADVIRLEHELVVVVSHRDQAVKDGITAWENQRILRKQVELGESVPKLQDELKDAYTGQVRERRAGEAMLHAVATVTAKLAVVTAKLGEAKGVTATMSFEQKQLQQRLTSATARCDSLEARLTSSQDTVKRLGTDCSATLSALKATATNLRETEVLEMASEARVAEMELQLEARETELEARETELELVESQLKSVESRAQ